MTFLAGFLLGILVGALIICAVAASTDDDIEREMLWKRNGRIYRLTKIQ